MPKAVQIHAHGGPEVLTYTDVKIADPGPGQLLVDVAAAGVNYIDTYYRTGAYPAPLPYTCGVEGVGTIRAVGHGVHGFVPGDRVAWTLSAGSYAERVLVPASSAVAVPGGVQTEVAGAALLQGLTAHYLLNSVYPVRPGDPVLIHAAAGGTGLLLTQLARAKGARVFATASTPEKERLALAAGAEVVVSYQDFADRIRELTAGAGVAAVFDGVGRTTFDGSLAALRPRGTLALFGATSGPVPPFDPQRLNAAGSVFLTRPTLAHFIATREELDWRAGELFGAITSGDLDISIGGRYPLSEAARAHADLESRRTTGKLLLIP